MLTSVITVARNCSSTIATAIESVLSQDHPSIQYIVIDGNSTDGSQEIITKYLDSIDYYISEPDEGIADAWNKALDVANGDYILFVNGDDIIPKNFVSKALEGAEAERKVIVYGDTIFFSDTMKTTQTFTAKFNPKKIIFGFGFMHTSCMFPASAFFDFRFSLSNSIAADAEHLIWCMKNGYEFRKGGAVNFMRRGGVSDLGWKAAAHQYLNLLYENGLVDQKNKWKLSALIPIRHWNKILSITGLLRHCKSQVYYVATFLFNALFRISPFFLKRMLLRLMRFEVSSDAAIQGGIRVFGPGRLMVGEGSMVNRGVFLDNRKGISIGCNVNIAHDCRIYTLGHDIQSPSFASVGGEVIIEDYCVLFAACMIMPNVKIGRGAVILPGSVVTKDIPPFEIHGGNPATKIGDRNVEPLYSPARRFWFAN
ncbi:MAG: hypothetical protein Pars2KO_22100 [Parasphingorhabdus sp.]